MRIEIRKIDKRSDGDRVAVMRQETFDVARKLVVDSNPKMEFDKVPWDGIGTPVVIRGDLPIGLVIYRVRREGDS